MSKQSIAIEELRATTAKVREIIRHREELGHALLGFKARIQIGDSSRPGFLEAFLELGAAMREYEEQDRQMQTIAASLNRLSASRMTN